MTASAPLLFCCAFLAGCAARFEPTPLPFTNPASVRAEEAPSSRPQRLIAADALNVRTKAQLAGATVPTSQTPRADEQSVAGAKVYACPMHPEVQSDKPGQCPKCGMTLAKK